MKPGLAEPNKVWGCMGSKLGPSYYSVLRGDLVANARTDM